MRIWPCLVAVLAMCVGAGAQAQAAQSDPYISVSPTAPDGASGTGLVWWAKAMTIRPTAKEVLGVTIETLNKHRGDLAVSDPWCFANRNTRQSFVSADRDVQKEIEATLATRVTDPFQVTGRFTNGPILDAVVGNYQTCGGRTGGFLLIVSHEEANRKIVYLHEWDDTWGAPSGCGRKEKT